MAEVEFSNDVANDSPRRSSPRYCDLIMKGGVTSGVVYPLAVVELAKAFQFRNIGGASAGAIAAAAAAAAECGRQRGLGTSGFDELAQLPSLLGTTPTGSTRSRLFGFFQPQRTTSRLFDVATAALGKEGPQAWISLVVSLLTVYSYGALPGALPGLLLILWTPSTLPPAVGWALGLVVILVGAIVGAVAVLAHDALTKIPANGFGLCSGMEGDLPDTPTSDALTPWLHRYFRKLSGQPGDRPLTFGDLANDKGGWSGPGINLEVMTTCLTHGRPYRLPLRDDDVVKENAQFFFRVEDFSRLFPADVVSWMTEHPRPPAPRDDDAEQEAEFRKQGFLPLPAPHDLPVIVAVRMSLSFPVLLSAVPLYAVNYSLDKVDQVPRRCWFSDGGLSSNFPIHLFDTLLPTWPTFGIDLGEEHPRFGAGMYLPTQNSGATSVKWFTFDSRPGLGLLPAFLGRLVMTSKDWADATQVRLPGYRDRVAQVRLTSKDGGLNLNMSKDRIDRLANYGKQAGAEFVRRFSTEPQNHVLNWENHRQVRLRSALALVEEWLKTFAKGATDPESGNGTYQSLVMTPRAPSYKFTNANQQKLADKMVTDLLQLATVVDGASGNDALDAKSPQPRPELRVRPRI